MNNIFKKQIIFIFFEVPVDLSVKVKASLIGALFLIDFMFFEKPPNSDSWKHLQSRESKLKNLVFNVEFQMKM